MRVARCQLLKCWMKTGASWKHSASRNGTLTLWKTSCTSASASNIAVVAPEKNALATTAVCGSGDHRPFQVFCCNCVFEFKLFESVCVDHCAISATVYVCREA